MKIACIKNFIFKRTSFYKILNSPWGRFRYQCRTPVEDLLDPLRQFFKSVRPASGAVSRSSIAHKAGSRLPTEDRTRHGLSINTDKIKVK